MHTLTRLMGLTLFVLYPFVGICETTLVAEIDTIEGDKEVHGVVSKGIELLGFQYELYRPSSSRSAGSEYVRHGVVIPPARFVKTAGPASAKLVEAMLRGERIRDVTIYYTRRAGGKYYSYMTIKYTNVFFVSGRTWRGNALDPIASRYGDLEEWSFDAERVEWTTTSVDPDTGETTGEESTGWDLRENHTL